MNSRIALAVSLVAVLLFSGCTTEDVPPTVLTSDPATSTQARMPPSTPATSSSAPQSTTAAPTTEQIIIAQWQKYFTVQASLQGQAITKITDGLKPVATPDQALFAAASLVKFDQAGRRQLGDYKFSASTVKIKSSSSALVTECRDETNLQIVDIATGKVIETGARLKLNGSYVRGTDGVWRLGALDSVRQSC